jgi:predicted aspartyl protease
MNALRFWLVCVSIWTLVAITAEAAEDGVPSAGASEPPAEAVIAELPFESTPESNRIFVNLAPEGNRPLVLILDTGASYSVFTPLAARAAGVSVRRIKSTPYRRATRLGRDLQFYVDTRSSDTGSKTGWEYGLLGGNFLEHYVVELDFRGRRVRFLDPKKYRLPEAVEHPNEAVIPVQVVGRRVSVEIEMNGRSIGVLLDTGAHLPLILSGKAAKKLGVDVESLPSFGARGSTLGPVSVNFHETGSFRLASFDFNRMPVLVAPRGWYNIAGGSDSFLGYDTLSQFTLRIDYPRQRMWMRREDSTVTFQGVDYAMTREAGVLLHPLRDSYAVMAVFPDTPGSRLGLHPGDAITQPLGEQRESLEQTIRRIVRGEEILVARRGDDDIWMDVTLPEGGGAVPVADGQELERQRQETLRREHERADEWKRKKAERLYVEVDGGWILVEGYRKRRGPQEGEIWVSFEEMQQIKRERAEAEAGP